MLGYHPPGPGRPPQDQADPPGTRHLPPPLGPCRPPPGSRLQHTVYERPVRILLECILVYFFFLQGMGFYILIELCRSRICGNLSVREHFHRITLMSSSVCVNTTIIDQSKWGELGPISFIFMQCSAKMWPNNRLSPHCPENSGSTTADLRLNSTIHQTAGLMASRLQLVPLQRNGKMSIGCE